MAEARKIVQNPVLKLLTLPDREGITARGKSDSRIKPGLFKKRQAYLVERLQALEYDGQTARATHASKVLVWLGIESLSQAPTLTPTDLFSNATSAPLLFAWRDGYVAELAPSAFGKLSSAVRSATTPAIRSDIYGVERLELFSTLLAEDDRIAAEWDRAAVADGIGKLFVLRLPRFSDNAARESVVRNVAALVAAGGLRIAAARSDVSRRIGIPISRDSAAMSNELVLQQLAIAERAGASLTVALREEAVLRNLVLTGSVAKWEAVVPLLPTIPGDGIEPIGHYDASDESPIVGIIDGGYHGVRYTGAVAWRHLPALVPDVDAAVIHGNQVSSLLSMRIYGATNSSCRNFNAVLASSRLSPIRNAAWVSVPSTSSRISKTRLSGSPKRTFGTCRPMSIRIAMTTR